jgi:hypothetical protein
MLQSCGTSSLRHAESLNEGFSAPEVSPLKKSQPVSNDSVVREEPRTLDGDKKSVMAPIKQSVICLSILVFVEWTNSEGMVIEESQDCTEMI